MVRTPPVRRHIQIGTETAAFTGKETFGVDANSRLESDDAGHNLLSQSGGASLPFEAFSSSAIIEACAVVIDYPGENN